MSERINVDYSKKEKVAVTLTPSKSQFGTVVEPYNAVLSTSFMIDRTDANLVFRNSNIYDILNKQF
jgi:tubulin alpha